MTSPTRFSIAIALCIVMLVPAGWAQTAKAADNSQAAAKPEGLKPAPSKVGPRLSSSPQISSSSWEYWTNVSIPAGGAVNLDSQLDFSTADTVRVTIRSANGDLSGLTCAAYWTVPQLQDYNAADVVTGDSFYFANVGGVTFVTYGNQFRLRLVNNGTTTINLTNVLLYIHSV